MSDDFDEYVATLAWRINSWSFLNAIDLAARIRLPVSTVMGYWLLVGRVENTLEKFSRAIWTVPIPSRVFSPRECGCTFGLQRIRRSSLDL